MTEMVALRYWVAKRPEGNYHSIHSCKNELCDVDQELEVPEEGLDSRVGSSPTH